MSLRVLVPLRREAVAIVISALLFGIAFPPFPLLVPAFVCLVPVTLAVVRRADAQQRWQGAARIGFWFGLIAYGVNLYWIAIALRIYTNLAILGYVASLLVLAPVVAIAMAVLSAARRTTRLPLAVLLPVIWVASELLLDHMGPLAFPWLPLGLSVSGVPALSQAADISGVRGLSFWIALTNGLIVDAWMLRKARRAVLSRAAIIALLLLLVEAYGIWRVDSIQLRPVAPVAIVQPNVPQTEKWQAQYQWKIVGMLASLSRERLARHDAALMLWPEAALPGFLSQHPDWADTVRTLARDYHTPIIFGVLDLVYYPNGDFDYYNAAMLADSMGTIGTQPTYHKSYLVPIVERVPFVNPRWFAKFNYFGGYGRGGTPVPFRLPFGKVGVLICYESIFPQRSRQYRRDGVSLLVNITNDAWFGRSLAPHQHAAHLVMRAIENRVGIVRAANTGISEYVDPLGDVHGATDLFVPATATYQAQTTDLIPLYVRVGDWIGTLSALATLALVVLAWRRRRTP